MLSEFRAMEEEQKTEQAQVETKNSGEKDVQAQEETKFGLEETVPQHEKGMQDAINSIKRDILNKLDEIKTELSLEIKDIIKSQKYLENQVQTLNPLHGNSVGKDSLEGFYAGAVTKTFYPVVVDHITSGVNAIKKKIPQNILDQYPELAVALLTSPGPISTLFETYNFLRDIPDIVPQQKAKSQILKILKGLPQVAEIYEHQESKVSFLSLEVANPRKIAISYKTRQYLGKNKAHKSDFFNK